MGHPMYNHTTWITKFTLYEEMDDDDDDDDDVDDDDKYYIKSNKQKSVNIEALAYLTGRSWVATRTVTLFNEDGST